MRNDILGKLFIYFSFAILVIKFRDFFSPNFTEVNFTTQSVSDRIPLPLAKMSTLKEYGLE